MTRINPTFVLGFLRQWWKGKPERLPRKERHAFHPDKDLSEAVDAAIWEGWNKDQDTLF